MKWNLLTSQFDTNYYLESKIGYFTTRKNFTTGMVEIYKGGSKISETRSIDSAFKFVDIYIKNAIDNLEVVVEWKSVLDGWIANYSFTSFVVYKAIDSFVLYSKNLDILEHLESKEKAEERILEILKDIKNS